MMYESDHSMVVIDLYLGAKYKIKKTKFTKTTRKDYTVLWDTTGQAKEEYQTAISNAMSETGSGERLTANEVSDRLAAAIKAAEETILPDAPRQMQGHVTYYDDNELKKLQIDSMKIRRAIYSRQGVKPEKLVNLKKRRAEIKAAIGECKWKVREKHLSRIATEIESTKDARKMYSAARLLTKGNKKGGKFLLQGKTGAKIYQVKDQLPLVTDFYKTFFDRAGTKEFSPWRGEARPLTKPFTNEEVAAAAKRIGNNRAVGPDGMHGEGYKYGGQAVMEALTTAYNQIFMNHESIASTQHSYLYVMNKPGKAPQAENTRPLAFQNVSRKILTNTILARLQSKIGKYLSIGQHAYRAGRSTAEVIWTLQWQVATAEKYAAWINLVGIDLSKAFDCLDRLFILDILEREGLADEDELRAIQYLLADTTSRVKIGSETGDIFATKIGVPQGDSLSPILFLIYMEAILREAGHREKILKINDIELAYADDFNFLTTDWQLQAAIGPHLADCRCARCRANWIIFILEPVLSKYHMQMNAAKTTRDELTVNSTNTTTAKMTGNSINSERELKERISKTNTAFNSMWKIWMQGAEELSLWTKLRIYNTCVQPIYLYNIGAAAYTKSQMDKLNTMHRKHLRSLMRERYSTGLSSNLEVYKKTKQKPIEVLAARQRMKLLGHILRMDKATPANQSMIKYLSKQLGEKRGDKTQRARALTTLPRLLQNDIRKLGTTQAMAHFNTSDLKTAQHLGLLWHTAQERDKWRKGTEAIVDKTYNNWKNKEAERRKEKYGLITWRSMGFETDTDSTDTDDQEGF